MIGGCVTIFANRAGVDIWFAMLVLAPLVVGVIGLVVGASSSAASMAG
jgi:branched-chain amino acid transport system permease protein